jgi:hypothetical protein
MYIAEGKIKTLTKKSKFSLKRILLVQTGVFQSQVSKVLESVSENFKSDLIITSKTT